MREWWWRAHRELVGLGVGGWWLDGGEGPPATGALAGGTGRALHNIYDRLRHQAFAEGEAAARPEQRVFLLCRSGAAGMQRFGASTLVGRHQQRLPDAGGAGPARAEHGAVRACRTGARTSAASSIRAGDGRALRALVPVRRLQPDLPLARLGLARARALGPRPRDRGDLPPLRRAALPAAALHLHAGLAGAHARPAADAAAGSELPRRPARVDARPRVPLGRRPPGRARHARGRHRLARLPAAGTWFDFWTGERHEGPARRDGRRAARPPPAAGRGPARSCRSARSCSTPASARSTSSRSRSTRRAHPASSSTKTTAAPTPTAGATTR